MEKTLNTSLRQSVKLDIPSEDYFLTIFEEHDVEAVQEIMAFDSVNNNLIAVPKPYTLEDAKFWITHCINAQNALLPIPTIQQRKTLFFSYEDSVPIHIPLRAIRHNGKFIGCCSLSQQSKEEEVCELGYYIHPDYQGKRIMHAACKEVLKYAANEFGIRKVLCSADVCNPASRRNIERLVKDYGDVVVTQKSIHWPPHKKVEGRNLYSIGTTWTWNIEPDEGY